MLLLGVSEAVARTLNLIDRVDLRTDRSTKRNDETDDTEGDDDRTSELQHLLSFWTLFFSLSFLESLRASPSHSSLVPKSPVKIRFFNSLKSLRYTYVRFLRVWIIPLFYRSRYAYLSLIQSNPRLDFANRFPKFPTVPFAAQFANLLTPTTYFPRNPTNFPQPLPAGVDLSKLQNLPLPLTYFSSSPTTSRFKAELRWEVVKLLILWTGLRKDSFGAKSVMFDWILGPIVRRRREARRRTERDAIDESEDYVSVYRMNKTGESEGGGGGADDRNRGNYTTQRQIQAQDSSKLPSSPSPSHSRSSSLERPPRPPPIWTTQTPPRPPTSRLDGSIYRKPFQTPSSPARNNRLRPTPMDYTTLDQEESQSSVSDVTDSSNSFERRKGGRESLLLESPPRFLDQDKSCRRRRRSYSSNVTSQDDTEEGEEKEKDSPARTEAEEGIKRWATVLRSQHSETALELAGETLAGEARGLEAIGRGWSV